MLKFIVYQVWILSSDMTTGERYPSSKIIFFYLTYFGWLRYLSHGFVTGENWNWVCISFLIQLGGTLWIFIKRLINSKFDMIMSSHERILIRRVSTNTRYLGMTFWPITPIWHTPQRNVKLAVSVNLRFLRKCSHDVSMGISQITGITGSRNTGLVRILRHSNS